MKVFSKVSQICADYEFFGNLRDLKIIAPDVVENRPCLSQDGGEIEN